MPSLYFILEHPTRGVVKDWDFDDFVDGKPTYKFRFSATAMRNDDVLLRFHNVREAYRVLDKMTPRLRKQTTVRRSTDWEAVGRD